MRLPICIFLLRCASLKLTGTDLLVAAALVVLLAALVVLVELVFLVELALVDDAFVTVVLGLLGLEYSPAGHSASASWGIANLGMFQDSSASWTNRPASTCHYCQVSICGVM